jgi:glycopeptide antibiotics resistance protein
MGEQKHKNTDWRIVRIVIWMLLFTWFPLDFNILSPEQMSRKIDLFLHPYLRDPFSDLLFDVMLNILFFIPFGVLLAVKYPLNKIKFISYGIVLSLFLELGQFFLPTRIPSVYDVGANAVGCMIGGLWSLQLRRIKHRIIGKGINANVMRLAAVLLLISATIFCLYWIQQSRLTIWHIAYPMQLAQNSQGNWKWEGEIFEVALYAGKNLDMNELSNAYRYRIEDYASWLYAAKNSNKFAVKLRLVSHTIQQNGPWHILSNARGYYEGNLIIGQLGDSLTVNIATCASQPGGSNPIMIVPAVFKPGEPIDLLIYFDGFQAVVKKNDIQIASMFYVPEAAFWANWNYIHPQNLYLFKRLFWLMIWLPVGLVFGYGWRNLTLKWQLAFTSIFITVFFVGLWRSTNYLPQFENIFWSVFATVLGLVLAQPHCLVNISGNTVNPKKERVLA